MIEFKIPAGLLAVYGLGVLADATPDFVSVFGQHGVIGGIAIVSTLSHLYVINWLLADRKREDEAMRVERQEERNLSEKRIEMLSDMAVSIAKLADSLNDLKDRLRD